jgi:hypothetical protein
MTKQKTIFLFIVIIAIVGFFLWKNMDKKAPAVETPTQVVEQDTTSDPTASLEAELNAIDTEFKLDSETSENQKIERL